MRLSMYMFNVVHAKYHQAKCSGSWVILCTNFFALSHNSKESENSVLWPWLLTNNLKFSGFRGFVKTHVPAKFHQAGCSGSRVIVLTETQNSDENNTVRRYCADSNYKTVLQDYYHKIPTEQKFIKTTTNKEYQTQSVAFYVKYKNIAPLSQTH